MGQSLRLPSKALIAANKTMQRGVQCGCWAGEQHRRALGPGLGALLQTVALHPSNACISFLLSITILMAL